MSNLIIPTADSVAYGKDCADFICLEDGTMTRECKYCNRSKECRQIDIIDGVAVPMESHYLPVNENEWEYLCTGMHDKRPLNERKDDDKAS